MEIKFLYTSFMFPIDPLSSPFPGFSAGLAGLAAGFFIIAG